MGAVDATLVVVNNDGGGIFHGLPIRDFDPPFTELFETPHGLEFEHAADLFGLRHAVVSSPPAFETAYQAAIVADGTGVVEVRTDAEASFGFRDRLQAELVDRLT